MHTPRDVRCLDAELSDVASEKVGDVDVVWGELCG